MARVKICGLTDPDTVRRAAEAGADWIGFVFFQRSPRAVTPEAVETLLLSIGEATPVALMVDPDDALIDRVIALGIRTLQLHGHETPERVAEIKARTGAQVWKAAGVSTRADLDALSAYAAADRLLADAKPPKDADRMGGHGRSFDWSVLEGWTPDRPWILAGGLTPYNVTGAIALTGATAVDVSSGVERGPGLKDTAKIKAFITAAKSA